MLLLLLLLGVCVGLGCLLLRRMVTVRQYACMQESEYRRRLGRLQVPQSRALLTDYLERRESGYADIIERAEKKIVWADPATKAKSKTSLLVLHGESLCPALGPALLRV